MRALTRRHVLAALLILGWTSVALAIGPVLDQMDTAFVRAFGPVKSSTCQDVAPGSGASARNATAFEAQKQLRFACKGDVRYKMGNSSVTAAATDAMLPAATVEYEPLSAGNTHIAFYGDGAGTTCNVCEKDAPVP